MAEISLEEIIREAKKRKIDLGADPEKTIKVCSKPGDTVFSVWLPLE